MLNGLLTALLALSQQIYFQPTGDGGTDFSAVYTNQNVFASREIVKTHDLLTTGIDDTKLGYSRYWELGGNYRGLVNETATTSTGFDNILGMPGFAWQWMPEDAVDSDEYHLWITTQNIGKGLSYDDDCLQYGLVTMDSKNLFSQQKNLFDANGTPIPEASIMIKHCGDRKSNGMGGWIGTQKIEIWYWNVNKNLAAGWEKIDEFPTTEILVLTTMKFEKVGNKTELHIDFFKANNSCEKVGTSSLNPNGVIKIKQQAGASLDTRVESQYIYPSFFLSPTTKEVSMVDVPIHQLLGIKFFE